MTDLKAIAEFADDVLRSASAIEQLTKRYPDLSAEDPYSIQKIFVGRRIERGESRIGVKMGLTSRAKMQQVGVDEVAWGRLTDG